MRTHTNNFKNNMVSFGREFDYKITYNNQTLPMEDIKSINYCVRGNLLKTTMKELKLDSKTLLSRGTTINYQIGLKVGNSFEYLDMGNYIVEKVEEQKDSKSYLLTCYDKMLLTMVDYEDLSLTFPITIRDYIDAICTELGITFANSSDTFINYNQELATDLYLDENKNKLGYTYRDVLDDIAEVTGSMICINNDDELEIRYLNTTNDTIDENYFNDVNVVIGKKYGPINSLVFSRTGEDNIYRKDDTSITQNGLCELKITDNQILNDNDRGNYIDDLFDYLKGLYYYINDFDSRGIVYYELGDVYTISINSTTYKCILLNDEINVSGSLKETIYTEEPDTSETEYKKADTTDKKINQTSLIVDKQEQTITGLVSKTETMESQVEQNGIDITNANTNISNVNTDLQSYKQTVATQFTQTNQDFTFQFNNVTDLINQVSNTEASHYTELHNYIRFISTPSGPVIVLGQEGSELTAELSNTRLSFKQNGTEVAYISNNKMFITDATVTHGIQIGNFAFVPRNNGSLSFRKVI